MSRSYNYRNKDNTDNEYFKYYFGPSSFRSKTEELDEREKRYKTKLKNKSGIDSVPRFYKRYCNRKIKNDFNRHLKKCLREERYDDILTPIIKRNHKYDYF